jgi:hypothetical protein
LPPDPGLKTQHQYIGASVAAHGYCHILKAEFMPICPVKYIFFNFMNKCAGLAINGANLIFLGWSKVVKSLTIIGIGACNRVNPSFVGNSGRTLKVENAG